MTIFRFAALLAAAVAPWLAASEAAAQASAPAAASASAPARPAPLPTSPAKKELATRILKLQQPGIEAMARALVEQPALQLLQQAGAALQRRPQAEREGLAREIQADVRKYAEEAVPGVQARALRLAPTTIGTLLEERFTEDELKQLIAQLESPLNRKFQSMAVEMQRSLSEKLVADSRGEVEPKVRALQQTVARRLGLNPDGGAASEPKSARPAAGKK